MKVFEFCLGGEREPARVTSHGSYSIAECETCRKRLRVLVVDGGRRRIVPFHFRRSRTPDEEVQT